MTSASPTRRALTIERIVGTSVGRCGWRGIRSITAPSSISTISRKRPPQQADLRAEHRTDHVGWARVGLVSFQAKSKRSLPIGELFQCLDNEVEIFSISRLNCMSFPQQCADAPREARSGIASNCADTRVMGWGLA